MKYFNQNHKLLGLCTLLCALSFQTFASFHQWDINEVYSNNSGTIQFIELYSGSDNQGTIATKKLTTTSDGVVNEFVIQNNISSQTTDKYLLFATAGYALKNGAVTPDFILPDHFFSTKSATVVIDFAGVDSLSFNASVLPTDGY